MSRLGLERVAKRFEVDSRGDLLRAQTLGCAFADDSGHVLEKADAVGQDSFASPDPPVAGHQHIDVELVEAPQCLDQSIGNPSRAKGGPPGTRSPTKATRSRGR